MIEKLIEEIKILIERAFPNVNVIVEDLKETKEYFVLIDDKDVYNSDEYLEFITDLNMNLLMQKGISNVFFSYRVYDIALSIKANIIKNEQDWSKFYNDDGQIALGKTVYENIFTSNAKLLEAA